MFVDLIGLMRQVIAGHAPYSMSPRMPVVCQPLVLNGVWMSYVVLPQSIGGHSRPDLVGKCFTCKYWVAPKDADERDPEDDWEGTCHRHAPRPTLGDFEPGLLRHVSHLSWDVVRDWTDWSEEQKEFEFKYLEESHSAWCDWPTTTGASWCGEWKETKQC